MKTCPKCDIDFYDGNYCRTCGTILIPVSEVRCNCGNVIAKRDDYCRWCGRELD